MSDIIITKKNVDAYCFKLRRGVITANTIHSLTLVDTFKEVLMKFVEEL